MSDFCVSCGACFDIRYPRRDGQGDTNNRLCSSCEDRAIQEFITKKILSSQTPNIREDALLEAADLIEKYQCESQGHTAQCFLKLSQTIRQLAGKTSERSFVDEVDRPIHSFKKFAAMQDGVFIGASILFSEWSETNVITQLITDGCLSHKDKVRIVGWPSNRFTIERKCLDGKVSKIEFINQWGNMP